MPNPLMPAMGGGMPGMGGPMGNMMQMMQQFQQFKRTFQGDPRQTVQQMLNDGRLTQSQLNQAQQMARQFQAMMGDK